MNPKATVRIEDTYGDTSLGHLSTNDSRPRVRVRDRIAISVIGKG
jgi:hypothetical protein